MIKWIKFFFEKQKMKKQIEKSIRQNKKEYESFKNLTKEEFSKLSEHQLLSAALAWVSENYEKLDSLPKQCQNVIYIIELNGEVYNGGFNQYYCNKGNSAINLSNLFTEIGAFDLNNIIQTSYSIYEKDKSLFEKLKNGTVEEFCDSYNNNLFNNLDEKFYEISEKINIEQLLIKYIKNNIGSFGN